MQQPNEHLENVTEALKQACDDAHASCRKSVDAFMEAGSAAAKGCEEFSRKFGSLLQESAAHAFESGKTMLGARSFQELADMQQNFIKNIFDSWLQGTGHLTQISTRVTREALEPVVKNAHETVNQATQRARQGRAA